MMALGNWTTLIVGVLGVLFVSIPMDADAALTPLRISVDGLERVALVHLPEGPTPAGSPVVFIFHGHGGTAESAAKGFAIEQHWPEAICVYMQGVPTASRLDPQGRRSGWQRTEEDFGGRDFKFFDAVLAQLRTHHKVDNRRIYVTGFSNGGAFTFALWAARGDVLAAVAPCGAQAGANLRALSPKPCLELAGKGDNVVGWEPQQNTMEAVRRLNGCQSAGRPWNQGSKVVATLYPSPTGTPFVSVIHPGGHTVPKPTGQLIVRFFKEQVKK
jgi:polyhydroxybutyrate depolymerase